MGLVEEGFDYDWIIETAISASVGICAFVLSLIQLRQERQVAPQPFIRWYFHRANALSSLVVVFWVLDLHQVFGIYPPGLYFLFAVNTANWLWTQGIIYFYVTERTIASQQKKAMSAKVKISFVALVACAWFIGNLACFVEFGTRVHEWFWIYNLYMSIACFLVNIISFLSLRDLYNQMVVLNNNLGGDRRPVRSILRLWIGNTLLLALAAVGFAVTAEEHYQIRRDRLSDVDVVPKAAWEFTRRFFFVLLALLILYYYIYLSWIPVCGKRASSPSAASSGSQEAPSSIPLSPSASKLSPSGSKPSVETPLVPRQENGSSIVGTTDTEAADATNV